MVTRRRFLQLLGLLAAGLAGCRSSDPPAPPRPTVNRADALRARVRAQEDRLIAAYDATMVRHPSLRPILGPVRAQHAAHLAAVTDPPSSLPNASGRAGGAATPGASAAATTAPVPTSAAAAVRALVTAERTAAAARAADSTTAEPALAGLLASIGGSEAAHAAALPVLAGRVAPR